MKEIVIDVGESPSTWFEKYLSEYREEEDKKLIVPFKDISRVSVELYDKYKAHGMCRRTWMIAMDIANKELKPKS